MKPRASNRGFTLFEVILASAIFVLLAGGIYFAVSTSVAAADELAREQMDARKLGAFADFLRDGFLNLPPEARIFLRADGDGGVQLIVTKAAGAFVVASMAARGAGVILGAGPDGKGGGDFRLARFPGRSDDAVRRGDSGGVEWLPLLDGVKSVRWRFFDRFAQRYVETWENAAQRPELVELTLGLAGATPRTFLFQSPRLGPGSDDGAPLRNTQ